DGAFLATGGTSGEIDLWDVGRGDVRLRLEGHRNQIYRLSFDPAGALLASSAWDETTRLWEVAGGRQLVGYRAGAPELHFSTDGQTLSCACDAATCQLIEIVQPTGYRRLTSHTPRTGRFGLDLSADWSLAAVAGNEGIRLVDVLAGQDLGCI